MKKIIPLFFALFFSVVLFAQAPQGINYQGVLRNNFGAAVANQNIRLEFKIWQGNPAVGSILYSETKPTTTDTFGLYTHVIGTGTPNGGSVTFANIPWSAGNIWVEVYADPTGGISFNLIAQQQLMSVPYALYAATSGSSGGGASLNGQINNIPRYNNTGNGLGRSLIFQSTDSSSIGINNSSPFADAVLDIANTSTPGKGLLIPRMTDTQRTGMVVSAAHHGMMVFQTNNAGPLSPQGFWYYDAVSTTWLFMSPAQAVWTLSGNAVGSNFMGSLNDADVIFKTGNNLFSPTERMRILSSSNGGNVQFGLSPNHYIFPAAKGNAGDILQLDPSGTNNLIWKPTSGSSSPWIKTGGLIFQNVLSDTVGIGTSTPHSTLDIVSINAIGALNVANTGTAGGAAAFAVTSAANDSAALVSYTKGNGPAILGITQGTGNAGAFGVLNSTSTANGVIATTAGNGKAVFGINSGSGYGGLFMVSNSANDSAALAAYSLGKGPSIMGYSSGLGNAGVFQIANSSNIHNALDAVTNGGGSAGNFQINNAGNNNSVITVATNGGGAGVDVVTINGSAVSAMATGGSALNAVNSGGGHTINAKNTGNGGSAGNFQISNNTNGNAALLASTSGTGFSGDFSGGGGLRTDKLRVTNGAQPALVLTAANTNGDATWTPLPGATNFAVNPQTTAQTFNANTTNVPVNMGTPTYTNGGASFSGNAFVAPNQGLYHFDVQMTVNNLNTLSGGVVTLTLYDPAGTGTPLKQVQYPVGGGASFSQAFAISGDVGLLAGQKVVVTLSNNSTGTNYTINTNPLVSWFSGHRVF